MLHMLVYKAEQEQRELTHLHPSGASRRPGTRAMRGLQAEKPTKQKQGTPTNVGYLRSVLRREKENGAEEGGGKDLDPVPG
jgi:hypothetical protein